MNRLQHFNILPEWDKKMCISITRQYMTDLLQHSGNHHFFGAPSCWELGYEGVLRKFELPLCLSNRCLVLNVGEHQYWAGTPPAFCSTLLLLSY